MKFAKLLAFFGVKQVATTIAEKGDGTVTLNADQAAAAETLAGELETATTALANAQEELATANTNLSNMTTNRDELQNSLNAANNSLADIRTALNIEADASIVDAIKTLGKQPGSLGATVTKDKDKNGDTAAAETMTSFDTEAQAIYEQLHGKK